MSISGSKEGKKDGSNSKTPTATIKIAAKDASQRMSSGQADPGPGDPLAAPSVAPELVDIPRPPTASQLVVKSNNSRIIKTINDPVSLPKNTKSASYKSALKTNSTSSSGQHGNPLAAEVPTRESALDRTADSAPRESTSSKALSTNDAGMSASAKSGHVAAQSQSGSGRPSGGASGAPSAGVDGSIKSTARFTSGPKSADSAAAPGGPTASTAMQANSYSPGANVHDEVEEGEGEVELPAESPVGGATSPGGTVGSGGSGLQKAGTTSAMSGGVDTAPASAGSSKMSPKTSGRHSASNKSEPTSSPESSAADYSSGPSADHGGKAKKKKKVTKFRYHKRITVRTHGKTSPSAIMDKVNKKDHNAALTPSTIGDMDPQELMKRAGIKGNKKAHWRVRLRQTKRLTKNGKTVTQTKVAYRDSEGNKRVKTVPGTECKNCGKKVEECKCDDL